MTSIPPIPSTPAPAAPRAAPAPEARDDGAPPVSFDHALAHAVEQGTADRGSARTGEPEDRVAGSEVGNDSGAARIESRKVAAEAAAAFAQTLGAALAHPPIAAVPGSTRAPGDDARIVAKGDPAAEHAPPSIGSEAAAPLSGLSLAGFQRVAAAKAPAPVPLAAAVSGASEPRARAKPLVSASELPMTRAPRETPSTERGALAIARAEAGAREAPVIARVISTSALEPLVQGRALPSARTSGAAPSAPAPAAPSPSSNSERGATRDRERGKSSPAPERGATAAGESARAAGRTEANAAAPLAADSRVARGTVDSPRAAVPAAPALEEPWTAPRSVEHVTLQLASDSGIEGRLRVAVRGDQLHATLVSNDGATAQRWSSGIDQLRQALGDRGFGEPRLAVHHAAAADSGERGAAERDPARTPRDLHRDSRTDDPSRDFRERQPGSAPHENEEELP